MAMTRYAARILWLLVMVWGGPVWADTVATVTRLAGMAELAATPPQDLHVGSVIALGDTIMSGAGARVELRFVDGMDLTLGENARLLIDTFVYDPDGGGGQVALRVDQGAFRLISGSIAKQPDHPFRLITPYASIGVRGTDFWGGPLEDPFEMVALDGTIVLTTAVGVTVLTKGMGVEIKSLGAGATVPHVWSPAKVGRAVQTITFP